MDEVYLYPLTKYQWKCQNCGEVNEETSKPQHVECPRCGMDYKVETN